MEMEPPIKNVLKLELNERKTNRIRRGTVKTLEEDRSIDIDTAETRELMMLVMQHD
jgi:hypothetical protein